MKELLKNTQSSWLQQFPSIEEGVWWLSGFISLLNWINHSAMHLENSGLLLSTISEWSKDTENLSLDYPNDLSVKISQSLHSFWHNVKQQIYRNHDGEKNNSTPDQNNEESYEHSIY